MCPYSWSRNLNSPVMGHFLGKLTYLGLWFFSCLIRHKIILHRRRRGIDMTKHLLGARHFTRIISCNVHKFMGTCYYSHFTDEEIWGSERLSNLSKVTQLVRWETEIWMSLSWVPFNYVRTLEPQLMGPNLSLGSLSWSYWCPLIFTYRPMSNASCCIAAFLKK